MNNRKEFYPDFYRNFRCAASGCPDTCCRDWDIVVDDESFEFYSNVPGEFGRKLSDNIKVDEEELIRGALLHDYFLYDWHEKSLENSVHGFTHPLKALNQAKKDFELSAIERDMILNHMFPLTLNPPRSKEGKLLCLADKLCATKETLRGKNRKVV